MLLPLQMLRSLISDFGGEVDFDSPCTTKMSPHSWPTILKGVAMIDGNIFGINMDDTEILLDSPSYVVNTLIQRLKWMKYLADKHKP